MDEQHRRTLLTRATLDRSVRLRILSESSTDRDSRTRPVVPFRRYLSVPSTLRRYDCQVTIVTDSTIVISPPRSPTITDDFDGPEDSRIIDISGTVKTSTTIVKKLAVLASDSPEEPESEGLFSIT